MIALLKTLMTEPRTRVAAIDCGTNSIRLLISDIQGAVKTDHLREMHVVRLGAGVDENGYLSQEAIDRTLRATRDYAEIIALLGVDVIRFCATSAVRDADNGDAFGDAIEGILGVRPVVLSGVDEARTSFLGATRELGRVRTMVVDIGGGSTEVVVGTGEVVEWSTSLDVGSVRLTERFLKGDPPSVIEVTECVRHIDAALAAVAAEIGPISTFVGVAGTITTVAAHVLALSAFDFRAIHLARLDLNDVHAACRSLVAMSVAERRALPFMHPGRADVIDGGALILDRIIELLPFETDTMVVSEHDILDGIAWGTV